MMGGRFVDVLCLISEVACFVGERYDGRKL